MATLAQFYQGSEVKFAIDLQAQGFSMDTDDFDIEVKSGKTSVIGHKGDTPDPSLDVVIYSETVQPEQEGDEPVTIWYAIVDTAKLNPGNLNVIATAYVPDAHANDGIRKEIAVDTLGKLV